ncbi:MAG: YhbY family RNA-binding protein [Desulfobacterales bacterium]|nr:YhbY family RNA-binding protein [Desulfobacterales bacterium]
MEDLKGYQKKYLRGLAHGLKPVVFVGQKGFTDALVREVGGALKTHELIKVKFVDFKEKDQKETIAASIVAATGAAMAGMIGHMAIFYLRHPDPDKRKIKLPTQSE